MDVVKVSGADSVVVNETMGMEVVVMADSGTSIPPRLLDLKLEEHQPIAVVVGEESDSKVASTPTVTDQVPTVLVCASFDGVDGHSDLFRPRIGSKKYIVEM